MHRTRVGPNEHEHRAILEQSPSLTFMSSMDSSNERSTIARSLLDCSSVARALFSPSCFLFISIVLHQKGSSSPFLKSSMDRAIEQRSSNGRPLIARNHARMEGERERLLEACSMLEMSNPTPHHGAPTVHLVRNDFHSALARFRSERSHSRDEWILLQRSKSTPVLRGSKNKSSYSPVIPLGLDHQLFTFFPN